jgi:hypothetical protein
MIITYLTIHPATINGLVIRNTVIRNSFFINIIPGTRVHHEQEKYACYKNQLLKLKADKQKQARHHERIIAPKR